MFTSSVLIPSEAASRYLEIVTFWALSLQGHSFGSVLYVRAFFMLHSFSITFWIHCLENQALIQGHTQFTALTFGWTWLVFKCSQKTPLLQSQLCLTSNQVMRVSARLSVRPESSTLSRLQALTGSQTCPLSLPRWSPGHCACFQFSPARSLYYTSPSCIKQGEKKNDMIHGIKNTENPLG